MKKINFKSLIPKIIILIIGILIGVVSTLAISKLNNNEKKDPKQQEERFSLDESPYTLEELYEITDNPELFYKENASSLTYYNIVMFHFYDYFTKDTPVKVATKCETDGTYKCSKVLETEYIDYYEYLKRMEDAYEYEEKMNEIAERNNMDPYSLYGFKYFIDELIYPSDKKIYISEDETVE